MIIPDRLIRKKFKRTAVSQEQAPPAWLALREKADQRPGPHYVPLIRAPAASSSSSGVSDWAVSHSGAWWWPRCVAVPRGDRWRPVNLGAGRYGIRVLMHPVKRFKNKECVSEKWTHQELISVFQVAIVGSDVLVVFATARGH